MTDEELETHLKNFEEELLKKVPTPTHKYWIITIVVTILTGLAVIGAGFRYFGILDQRVASVEAQEKKEEDMMKRLDDRMLAHHDDRDVHVDKQWKVDIKEDLRRIQDMLQQHMDNSSKRFSGNGSE